MNHAVACLLISAIFLGGTICTAGFINKEAGDNSRTDRERIYRLTSQKNFEVLGQIDHKLKKKAVTHR